MALRSVAGILFGLGLAGCGNVGSGEETVSLASAGVDVSVKVPTGGTVQQSGLGAAQVSWKGMSWNATFELNSLLRQEKNQPIAQDESGSFEAKTPVIVGGKSYVCWVRAKKEEDAKRIQTACDTLAAASPKTPAASDKPAAAAKVIELEDKFADKVGCSIKIPKGAKALMEDKYNTTYSLPLPGGLLEYNVSVNQAGSTSVDDAKRTATMMSGTVEEAKKLDNGMIEVVLAPQGPLQTVATFLPKFGAKCLGPKENLSLVREMCASLTAGDKVAAPGSSAPAAAPAEKPGLKKPKPVAAKAASTPAAAKK